MLPAKEINSYICFEADEEGYNALEKVMLALDTQERALFVEYDYEDRVYRNKLEFVSKNFPDPGFPKYELVYRALTSQNTPYAELTQTHSGIYDYLEFINDDGEVFNFTNIPEESYISESCL